MMRTRLQQKSEALKAQATHTNYEGQLFKFSGGHLWVFKEVPLWFGEVDWYPVWSKVEKQTLIRPIEGKITEC